MLRPIDYSTMDLTPLIWKLGADSDKDVIALSPITGPIERWLGTGVDFSAMPATTVWIAPRWVTGGILTEFKFDLFSALDPDDLGSINISVQQVTSVSGWMPPELRLAYLASLPDRFRDPEIMRIR